MCEHIVHSSLSFVSHFLDCIKLSEWLPRFVWMLFHVVHTLLFLPLCSTSRMKNLHRTLVAFCLVLVKRLTASVYRGQELTVLLRDIIVRMCTWNRNSLTFTISHSIYMYIMFVTFPSVFYWLWYCICFLQGVLFHLLFFCCCLFSQKEWERVFLCMYVYVRAYLFLFYFRLLCFSFFVTFSNSELFSMQLPPLFAQARSDIPLAPFYSLFHAERTSENTLVEVQGAVYTPLLC